MNLQKKMSVWKYIVNSDAGMFMISVLKGLIFLSVMCGSGYAWCKFFDHQDYFSNGLFVVVGFLIYIIGRTLIEFALGVRPTLALYKQATYLPMTVDELLENNIHGPQELEDFLVTKVFSDKTRSRFIYIDDVRAALEKSYMNSVDTYDFSKIPSEDNEHYAYVYEVKQDDNVTYKIFKDSVGRAMALYMVDWLHGHNKYVVHDSEEPVLGHGNDVMLENMLKYEYLCLK